MKRPAELLKRKVWSAIRYGMVHLLSGRLGLIVVNEFPKSGGTWLGQLLSRALEVPFPRNRPPLFESCIMHGHYLSGWRMKNVVVVFRDGRDVMVSWYHHCLMEVDSDLGRAKEPLVRLVRRELDLEDVHDIRKNLPKFIEYSFTRQRHPRFTWAEFVDRWEGSTNATCATKTSFERLKEDTVGELCRVVHNGFGLELQEEVARNVVSEFSFVRQSGRQPGQEDEKSFLRKGIVGDWKNYFSTEAREVFAHFAGSQLEMLGYEQDDRWVSGKVEQAETGSSR